MHLKMSSAKWWLFLSVGRWVKTMYWSSIHFCHCSFHHPSCAPDYRNGCATYVLLFILFLQGLRRFVYTPSRTCDYMLLHCISQYHSLITVINAMSSPQMHATYAILRDTTYTVLISSYHHRETNKNCWVNPSRDHPVHLAACIATYMTLVTDDSLIKSTSVICTHHNHDTD